MATTTSATVDAARKDKEVRSTSADADCTQKIVKWCLTPLKSETSARVFSYARRKVGYKVQTFRHWGLVIGEEEQWQLWELEKKPQTRELHAKVTRFGSMADLERCNWTVECDSVGVTSCDNDDIKSCAVSVIRHMRVNHGRYRLRGNNCQHFVKHLADLVCLPPNTQDKIKIEDITRIPKSRVIRSDKRAPKSVRRHPPILLGDLSRGSE